MTVALDVETSSATAVSPPRRRRPEPLTVVVLLAAAAFVVLGIGSPLLGRTVFAATDELNARSPYLDAGGAGTVVANTYMDDTYTFQLPATMLFVDELRSGRVASWNPYTSGGLPLAATPNYALASPLSLPFYLLPAWLAPAYEKLLELAVAIAGCFLFLRRLRLGRPAALLGGLVFAGSAFMVVWTGWAQTRVAAVIPLVFWAIERLVQRRRATDAALLSVATAALLLGGFPSVAAFTLLTAACYLAARAIATHPRRGWGTIAAGAVGLLGGVTLAAAQLLPFAEFLRTWLVEGRAQTPADHLSLAAVVTAVAPYALGSVAGGAKLRWYLPDNMVEALSYVGAAAVVLVIVAVGAPRAARALTPRGAWVVLTAATAGWAVLIYGGGPALALLQHAPVFDANAIGRARSVLGFLLAALAAIGFEVALRHCRTGRRWWWGAGVWAAALAVGGLACLAGLRAARSTPALAALRVGQLERQLLIAAALAAVTVGCVLVVMAGAQRPGRWWRPARAATAALIPLLVAGQGLSLVLPYYPRVPRDTFYPTTDVHEYLAAHLGHDRFAGTRNAMIMGVDAPKRLRALTGHGFLNADFADLVRGVPGNPIPYPTYVNLRADPAVAASPVLDRLAVRYLVASPRDPVIGVARVAPGDGGSVTLTPDHPVTAAVPGTGPIRAVGLTPLTPLRADPPARLEVTVRDGTGVLVARAQRLLLSVTRGTPFLVPLALPAAVPASARLTAVFTLRGNGPMTVESRGAAAAVSSVAPADDGLTIAHAGSAVVYERDTALPRIRWAARTVVEPDAERRVALLAAGRIGADQVLLDAPGVPADGRPAELRIDEDGTDRIGVSVRAAGAGYLVVADADQVGWVAEVDGRPAELVPADQGVVAVAVPAGAHTVWLTFRSPDHNLGSGLTLLSMFILVAVIVYPRLVRATPRHRRR